MQFILFVIALMMVCVQSFVVPATRILSTRRSLFGSPEEPSSSPTKGDKGGGMFGGMGDIMGSMKKAQEIAKQAETVNKELAAEIVVGNDPTGQVAATFNGLGQPIGLKMSESVMRLSAEEASLAATLAIVDAHTKSQGLMMSKMQSMYASAGLPAMK